MPTPLNAELKFLTIVDTATLAAATTNYNSITSTDAPGLDIASRVNIEANASGTTIRSIVLSASDPGRVIWIQNTGSSGALTMPNNDPAGTSGWRFYSPQGASFVLPAGAGVCICLDTSLATSAWAIRSGMSAGNVAGLAAIATSGSASDLVAGTVPAARMPALTGDVTSSAGSTATTIANDAVTTVKILNSAVTNAKLASMATLTMKGNSTGGSAAPQDLTAAQTKTLLAITASDVSGLAAIATSGSASDLVAGTVPAARMPALTGDVTSSAGSTATTIANDAVTTVKILNSAVTNAKLDNMPAATFKGSISGGTPIDLTVAQAKALLGASSPFYFGNGSDGTATMDGIAAANGFSLVGSTYTATRETFFVNLTVNSGITVKPDGYPIRVQGTLTNNGNINVNGNSASGNTPGAAPFSGTRPLPNGLAGVTTANPGLSSSNAPRGFATATVSGGAGNTSNVGGSGGKGQGGGGGGGGVGGGSAGGNGGPVSISSPSGGDINNWNVATTGTQIVGASIIKLTCGSSGGAGGLGGTNGGASGGSAGWMTIWATTFAGTGVYQAIGGNGDKFDPDGGGGGGGGGSGGVAVFVSNGATPTPVLTGGSGGPGGSLNGGPGGSGGVGDSYSFTP